MLLLAISPSGRAGAGLVDPRAWDELDIIPMPKEIRLTGKDLETHADSVTLVLGSVPAPQSEIGADWINRRRAALGVGEPLPVVRGGRPPATGTALIIGTPEDHSLIADAVRQGLLDFGRNNPGTRGYEIRRSADGRLVYLAGADNLGALYACVTFGELLERRGDTATWRAADVRDAPDLLYVTMGAHAMGSTTAPEIADAYVAVRSHLLNNTVPSDLVIERYRDALHAYHEQLLRWKITVLKYDLRWEGRPEFVHGPAYDVIRAGVEHGMQRGIRALVYAEKPFVGLKEHHPELADRGIPTGPSGLQRWIRTWSMDATRRATADALGRHLAAAGITDVGFHDTDTGGWDNPAQWNDRPEEDRRRWGDDYAAATAHMYRIYYDALKEHAPDIRMHIVLYPYHPAVFDPVEGLAWAEGRLGPGPEAEEIFAEWNTRFTDFYGRVHALLPTDISIAMREGYPGGVRRFRELTRGRGVFWWLAVNSPRWWTLLSEGAAWTGTFFDHPDDMIYLTYADAFVPFNSLAVREYSWNIDAPGARPFGSHEPGVIHYEEWSLRNNSPIAFSHPDNEGRGGFLFDRVLPRIARNLFGPVAAPAVAAAVRENIDTRQVFGAPGWSARIAVLHTPEDFARQAARCARALAGLDEVWALQKTDPASLALDERGMAYLVHLREVLHVTRWMALLREQEALASILVAAGDADAAGDALDRTQERLVQARDALQALVTERPANTYLDRRDHARYSGRTWRFFMADMVATHFEDAEPRIANLRERLPELAALGLSPAELLARERRARARRIAAAPVEEDWAAAAPIENFFVLRQEARLASAPTRVRLLHDGEHLYVRADLWHPGDRADPRDTLEVFLQAGDERTPYAHFFFAADGGMRQQWVFGRQARDTEWQAQGMTHSVRRHDRRWDLLARIPLRALETPDTVRPGESPWRLNLARQCPLPDGTIELSSIMDPSRTSFHDVEAFVPLAWTEESHVSALEVAVANLRHGERTLPDAIATVAEFGLVLDGNQVFHDVVLTVETLGTDGRVHQRDTLVEIERVVQRWRSPERFEARFDETVTAGRLRFTVQSQEGIFVREIPLDQGSGSNQRSAETE